MILKQKFDQTQGACFLTAVPDEHAGSLDFPAGRDSTAAEIETVAGGMGMREQRILSAMSTDVEPREQRPAGRSGWISLRRQAQRWFRR
ncbi:MAG TPA: hypothetical protein PLB97_01800 [Accumulibacter sp.]|nr:hypothetical protein [Bryobacteraceae bacterium]HOL64056.1 hypothetical protein [Accumulibacter sp.]HPP47421.1 hypothetical protein [Accumulibacter sp.]